MDLTLATQVGAELRRRSREALKQYEPLPKLEEWHRSNARVRLCRGGNRSGKTTAGAVETSWWVLGTHPYLDVPEPCTALCVGNDWGLVGNPMWKKLAEKGQLEGEAGEAPILPERAIQNISWLDKGRRVPQRVELRNGSVIDFKSCEAKERKFMGASYDFAWIDEELADELVYQEILRGLIDREGRLIWTATPLARARPLIDLHNMAGDPESPLEVFEQIITMLENPHIPEKGKLAYIATIPEDYYACRVLGEFLALEGLVYGDWRPEVHEVPPSEIPPEWPRMIAIDPGYADPCAVLWTAMPPGERKALFYREFYKKRRTVRQVAEHIVRETRNEPVMKVVIDKESLKKNMGYQESIYSQFNAAFKDLGFVHPVTRSPLRCKLAQSAVESGIYYVKQMLMAGSDGEPMMRAFDSLAQFKREMDRYMWYPDDPEKNQPKKPMDKHNHLMDCMRYTAAELAVFEKAKEVGLSKSARIWQMVKKEREEAHSSLIVIGG